MLQKNNNEAVVHLSRQQFPVGDPKGQKFGRLWEPHFLSWYKTVSLFSLLIVTHVTYREASNGKPRNRKVTNNIIYYCKAQFYQWDSILSY